MEQDKMIKWVADCLSDPKCKNLKKGESIEITCPICGGKVSASRSGYNGHWRLRCGKCGLTMVQ